MTTTTFTITTQTGRTVAFTKSVNTFESKNTVDHNFSNGEMTIVKFSATINGKQMNFDIVPVADYMTGETVERCRAAGVNYYFRSDNCIVIPTAESLVPVVDEILVGTGYESTQTATDEMIADAESILAAAETTIKNENGTYMTAEQAKDYQSAYNDFYNEGGEGFIPHITTAEAVAWANKTKAMEINCKRFNEIVQAAQEQQDQQLFLAEYGLPEWILEEVTEDEQAAVDMITKIHTVVWMTPKELISAAGLNQTGFARRFMIPLRTVQEWCGLRRTMPLYLKLMAAELLNILPTHRK